MNLILDPLNGQFLGDFEVAIDGKDLRFVFSGGGTSPPAIVEGSDLHLTLGNLIKPEKPKPILVDGITNLGSSDVLTFAAASQGIEITSMDDLLAVAQKLGPLFGKFNNPLSEDEHVVIKEPIKAWQIVAKNLNFAIRAKAVLDGRAPDDWLDDELYFMYYDFEDLGFTWMLFKRFSFGLPKAYRQALAFAPKELKGLFPLEQYVDDSVRLVEWQAGGPSSSGKPCLKATFTTHFAPELPEKRQVYVVSNQYMRSTTKANNETRLSMTNMIMQSLIKLHTYRVRYGWHNDVYALHYGSLLERLWHNVGVGASLGKFGICQHCGCLFNADTERKDRKLYCSLYCQEAAKSKRHYCKRVVREFVKQADGNFTIEDILEKHPSLDRAVAQEALNEFTPDRSIRFNCHSDEKKQRGIANEYYLPFYE
jgi:hypothetical protein